MTQHQRILLAAQRGWLCNDDFHKPPIQSWSPHKRRKDIEEGRYTELDGTRGVTKKYKWRERECTHGVNGSKDFLLTLESTGEAIAFKRTVHSREEAYELQDKGWTIASRETIDGRFTATLTAPRK